MAHGSKKAVVIAFVLESYSFLVALKQYLLMMRRDGYGNPFSYLLKSDDPTLVAVVLEAAVREIIPRVSHITLEVEGISSLDPAAV